jgi:hypothetical protein
LPFSEMMNDRITLVKKDGRRFQNLPASVQSGKISTLDPQIPIDDGDHFERSLPSGTVEKYLILDAGFHQAFHGIPAGYQSKVRKETALMAPTGATHVVYNLTGPNARVNIQSTDSSTNVVNVETSALFVALRKVVSESIADDRARQQVASAIDGMESTVGTPSFSDRYKEFIGGAADHMTVLAPFLPALSQLLL